MSDIDDFFDAAPEVKSSTRPTIKMLSRGSTPRTATYAKGGDNEQTVKNATGRTMIIRPVKVARNHVNPRFPDNPPSDRWTANIVVLDGDPITEILDKDGDVVVELAEPLVPPFLIENMYISNGVLGSQMEQTYARSLTGEGKGMMLAQLVSLPPKSQGGNKVYAFADYDPSILPIAKAWIKAHPEPDPFS